MRRFLPLAAATGIALALTAPAHAQYADEDTGFYLQGGYSYFDLEPDGADDGVDSSAISAQASPST